MGLCLPASKLIKFLESNGYKFVRQRGTSHSIYSNGSITVAIPVHGNDDIGENLIRKILRESELTKNELLIWLGRK